MLSHPTIHHFMGITTLLSCLLICACSKDPSLSAQYQAICHGERLSTIEARNQALEEGYNVDPNFHCITRASHLAMEEAQAQREAWRSAEALAKRQAQADARDAHIAQERERRRAAVAEPMPTYELHNVDVNTASEADIAAVCSIHPNTAADIVRERESNGPFADWANLVHRVVGMSSAQNAVFASTCALNVNGESLNGAPADAGTAQAIFQREHRRNRP